jgi:hypothetical protein
VKLIHTVRLFSVCAATALPPFLTLSHFRTHLRFESFEFCRKLILTVVAIFGATDMSLQMVYALIVCTLCLLFQVRSWCDVV